MGADVWSCGCILVEMLQGKALFQGDSEIGQVHEIFKILGTPTEKSWPGISKNAMFRNSFPLWTRKPFDELFSDMPSNAVELLEKILIYDQALRLSTKAILRYPFVEDAASQFSFYGSAQDPVESNLQSTP